MFLVKKARQEKLSTHLAVYMFPASGSQRHPLLDHIYHYT